jgi:hypothetical protein
MVLRHTIFNPIHAGHSRDVDLLWCSWWLWGACALGGLAHIGFTAIQRLAAGNPLAVALTVGVGPVPTTTGHAHRFTRSGARWRRRILQQYHVP